MPQCRWALRGLMENNSVFDVGMNAEQVVRVCEYGWTGPATKANNAVSVKTDAKYVLNRSGICLQQTLHPHRTRETDDITSLADVIRRRERMRWGGWRKGGGTHCASETKKSQATYVRTSKDFFRNYILHTNLHSSTYEQFGRNFTVSGMVLRTISTYYQIKGFCFIQPQVICWRPSFFRLWSSGLKWLASASPSYIRFLDIEMPAQDWYF